MATIASSAHLAPLTYTAALAIQMNTLAGSISTKVKSATRNVVKAATILLGNRLGGRHDHQDVH